MKLVAMPLIALAAARYAGLQGIHFDVALIFAALPTASSAYILAQRMGTAADVLPPVVMQIGVPM